MLTTGADLSSSPQDLDFCAFDTFIWDTVVCPCKNNCLTGRPPTHQPPAKRKSYSSLWNGPVELEMCKGFRKLIGFDLSFWVSLLLSCSVVSEYLWPRGLQHARLPCPSPSPGLCSNSCPLRQWCHPAFSSSAIPFSSCPQSLPASGSFPVSQLFASGGQSIGVSASASALPMSIQDWLPLEPSRLIALLSNGFSRVFSNTPVQKHQFFGTQPSLWSSSHIHTWLL